MPDDQFDAAVDRFARAGIGAAVFGAPGVLGALVGAPSALMLGYLVVALPIYVLFVIRGGKR